MEQKVTTAEADEIAVRTADAYSAQRYGEKAWRECCRALAERGYTASQIEEIMRSKYTRWARDKALTGQPAVTALLQYLDDPDNGFDIDELMREVA